MARGDWVITETCFLLSVSLNKCNLKRTVQKHVTKVEMWPTVPVNTCLMSDENKAKLTLRSRATGPELIVISQRELLR
jgi:hypothetical protein